MRRLLIVTAVEAERDAILAALPDRPTADAPDCAPDVLVGGVGPAAAAAATSAALAGSAYQLVISVGTAGGFAPLAPGEIAVAASIVFADLGAETGEPGGGFAPLSALGVAADTYQVGPQLAVELADCTGGHLGSILTVATVTGTAATAGARLGRHPDAVAEAMEGAGVAAAATLHHVAFAEVRAISNLVGPRDRGAWRIPAALVGLGAAVAAIAAREWST
jgi:futalosine hydrolase